MFKIEDNPYFDSNVERAMNIFTAFSSLNKDGITAESAIQTIMPYTNKQLQQRLELIIKAISVNRLLQKYSKLSIETQQINTNKREMLTALRQELNPHNQQVLDLFLKLSEIKELMEVVTLG